MGEDDFVCGPGWARQLHDGLSNSRLEVTEQCGHLAHVERPEVCYPEVLKFLP